MRTTRAVRAGRRLGQIAAVALVALLLSGLVAASAAADQRPEAKEANDFVDFCFRSGGDPTVFTYPDNSVIVVCADLPGGGDFVCEFVGNGRFCYVKGPEHPGGVLPNQPVDGVFVEEEPAQQTPQAMYEVVPIWSLYENDGGTEAPLRAAGGPSGRIAVLSGSAVAPASEASDGRVALGASTIDPAALLVPAPPAGEGTLPVVETDAAITVPGLTLPVEETDAPVTTELFPGEGTLPVEETDAEVTTETWEGTLPVEETDAPVSTEPAPAEGTLPVEETEAPVTTEQWEGTLPVEDTDAEVTTEPVPTADEQP
jgi:hypothetical protein